MSQCVICHRQQDDERMACRICQVRMDDRLVDILEFFALAEGELQPGRSGSGRSGEQGIGLRIDALDFVTGHDVVAILASWESDIRETYGLTIAPMLSRPGPLLGRSVTFLRSWLPRTCETFTPVDDMNREIHECWTTARSAARCSPRTGWRVSCPADLPNGDLCGTWLVVHSQTDQVTCRRCHTAWEIDWLMRVAAAAKSGIWVDREALLERFGISDRTLKRWVQHGRIARRGEMYDVRALMGVSDLASMSDMA